MTSLVTDTVRSFLHSPDYGRTSTIVDATVAILVIVVVAEHEVLRAYSGGARRAFRLEALGFAAAPLLLVLALVLFLRATGQR